jgi:hypothetical protein
MRNKIIIFNYFNVHHQWCPCQSSFDSQQRPACSMNLAQSAEEALEELSLETSSWQDELSWKFQARSPLMGSSFSSPRSGLRQWEQQGRCLHEVCPGPRPGPAATILSPFVPFRIEHKKYYYHCKLSTVCTFEKQAIQYFKIHTPIYYT